MQSILSKALKRNITPAQHMLMNSRAFAVAKTTNIGKLDENGEPRFLENVKIFLNRAS